MQKTHGLSNRIPEYEIWKQIRQRCLNRRGRAYRHYGARGIRLCERWNDFARFLEDMGNRPSADHTIERINNDGNYEPANCRWATVIEQMNNRRSSVRLTYNGVSLTIAQWTRRLGFSRNTISNRLRKGWPIERALSEPRQEAMINFRFRDSHGVSP